MSENKNRKQRGVKMEETLREKGQRIAQEKSRKKLKKKR